MGFQAVVRIFLIGCYFFQGLLIQREQEKRFKHGNKFMRDVPMKAFSKVPVAARYDRINLNRGKAYIKGFLFGPLIILAQIFFLACAMIHSILCAKLLGKTTEIEVTDSNGKKSKRVCYDEEQSVTYNTIQRAGVSFCCYGLMRASGVWTRKKKLKVSDFFADYVKYEEKNKIYKAPITISNHITGVDYILYMQQFDFPSLIVGATTRHSPFIGIVAEAMQCIFVDSYSAEDKKIALEKTQVRLNDIMENKRFPRLLLFPEGDTNAGHSLMKFKTGAFEYFSLLKICGIKIHNDDSICHNLCSRADSTLNGMNTFFFDVTMYEFDNFDPQYTLDKHNITKDDPRAVELVIEDVRYLYEYALGITVKENNSYSEKNQQEWYLYNDRQICYEPGNLHKRSTRNKSGAPSPNRYEKS